jgi:hypothetical protein
MVIKYHFLSMATSDNLTLFKSKTVVSGTDNILRDIPHIQSE